jgi:hypothetical protein
LRLIRVAKRPHWTADDDLVNPSGCEEGSGDQPGETAYGCDNQARLDAGQVSFAQRGVNDRLRLKEAALIARVSVGMINRWWREGRFKSWSVTRPGFDRGIRYIDAATFYKFLQSQWQETPQDGAQV